MSKDYTSSIVLRITEGWTIMEEEEVEVEEEVVAFTGHVHSIMSRL